MSLKQECSICFENNRYIYKSNCKIPHFFCCNCICKMKRNLCPFCFTYLSFNTTLDTFSLCLIQKWKQDSLELNNFNTKFYKYKYIISDIIIFFVLIFSILVFLWKNI